MPTQYERLLFSLGTNCGKYEVLLSWPLENCTDAETAIALYTVIGIGCLEANCTPALTACCSNASEEIEIDLRPLMYAKLPVKSETDTPTVAVGFGFDTMDPLICWRAVPDRRSFAFVSPSLAQPHGPPPQRSLLFPSLEVRVHYDAYEPRELLAVEQTGQWWQSAHNAGKVVGLRA